MEEENCRSKGPVCKWKSCSSSCSTEQRMKNISVQNTPGIGVRINPAAVGAAQALLSALAGAEALEVRLRQHRGDPCAAALGRRREWQSDSILQHSGDNFVPSCAGTLQGKALCSEGAAHSKRAFCPQISPTASPAPSQPFPR